MPSADEPVFPPLNTPVLGSSCLINAFLKCRQLVYESQPSYQTALMLIFE